MSSLCCLGQFVGRSEVVGEEAIPTALVCGDDSDVRDDAVAVGAWRSVRAELVLARCFSSMSSVSARVVPRMGQVQTLQLTLQAL